MRTHRTFTGNAQALALYHAAKAGDRHALDRLIVGTVHVANRHVVRLGRCSRLYTLDDAKADAARAAWQAYQRYDPHRGVPWIAFAVPLVTRRVLDGLQTTQAAHGKGPLAPAYLKGWRRFAHNEAEELAVKIEASHLEAVDYFKWILSHLKPIHRTLLEQTANGRTIDEIGSSIGRGHAWVSRHKRDAIRHVRLIIEGAA